MSDDKLIHNLLCVLDKINPEVLNQAIDAIGITDNAYAEFMTRLFYKTKDEPELVEYADEGLVEGKLRLVNNMTTWRDFKIITLDDGRQWVTDGTVGFDPHMAIKLIGMLKEISCIRASMSIEGGILWTEDGMSYDLEQTLKNVIK